MFPLLVWELVHQTINCIGYFTIENWIVVWTNVRVVIWCEYECPGWSFDVSMNVRGGHLMWARMSGPVKNRVGTNVRRNECPYTDSPPCDPPSNDPLHKWTNASKKKGLQFIHLNVHYLYPKFDEVSSYWQVQTNWYCRTMWNLS